MHAGHGIAGCPSRSIAQLGGTITHKGGAGGWWARGVRLPPIPDGAGAVRADGCSRVSQRLSPGGDRIQCFSSGSDVVPKGERSVRLETLSKRTADHQPGFNEPPQPPPPSSACPKTEPHRLSPSLCRWIFKGFSIVKGLLWE